MTTIIVSLAAERFRLEEKSAAKCHYTMNNKASKIHQLRKELKKAPMLRSSGRRQVDHHLILLKGARSGPL